MNDARSRWKSLLPREFVFFAVLGAFTILAFELARVSFAIRNLELARACTSRQLLGAFAVGLRFDLAAAVLVLWPFYVACVLVDPRKGFSARGRRRLLAACYALFTVSGLFLLCEGEFYATFDQRYNTLLVDYADRPGFVLPMIWGGFPVLRYLALAAASSVALCLAFRAVARRVLDRPACDWGPRAYRIRRLALALAGGFLLVVAFRGGRLGGRPLSWSDAGHSSSVFANDLALNGIFTGTRSIWDRLSHRNDERFARAMDPAEALRAARELVVRPGEELVQPERLPLARRRVEAGGPRLTAGGRPPNVVLVLCESFSARYVGAIGSPEAITPEFDELARHGVLFDRIFSAGSHTHQAVFSVVASFPHLPGHSSLMREQLARGPFSSLPELLGRRGYSSVFLYGGDLDFDGYQNFLTSHGIERMIGVDDFGPDVRRGELGVADEDLFRRANEEFEAMDRAGPFFGFVLTLSNHSPFDLPTPLPFPSVSPVQGGRNQPNGIRYTSWALGRFLEEARRKAYFDRTLFVVMGDHGRQIEPRLTPHHLLLFHVPLLLYAPALLGESGRVVSSTGGGVDVAPTVLGLLDPGAVHQSWGRDLLGPPDPDRDFALCSPSGGGDEVGFVQGDRLWQLDRSGREHLYRVDVGFPPGASEDLRDEEPERCRRMRRLALGYVQTGLDALLAGRIGLPEPEISRH